MKKLQGFTLFELVISIILISIIYGFAINSFQGNTKKTTKGITLKTLKKELLSFEYENEIKIYCAEKDLSCFLFIDDEMQKEKINDLFLKEPIVYKYEKNLDRKEFNPLELEKLETFSIVFEYACNKNNKCSELIVFEEERGYIFNDIHSTPIIVKSISEIDDYFEDIIQEVKDAF